MVLEAEGQDQAARRCRVRGGPVASQMVLLVCSRSLDVAEGRGNWGGGSGPAQQGSPLAPAIRGSAHEFGGDTHTQATLPPEEVSSSKIYFLFHKICLFV